jgi:DnaJ-class molecular chaperone
MPICPRCAGVGAKECSKCQDSAQSYQFQPLGFGMPDCSRCKGFGYIPCTNCDGTGEINRQNPAKISNKHELIGNIRT